jgi:putative oxidoreductase
MENHKSCWSQDVGKLLLRLTIGGLLLCHGIGKIQNGIDWMGPMLAGHNLPDFVRYGVYVGEVLAPVLVIAGFFTRIGGLIIAINMAVAAWLAHANELWKMDQMGGWARELDALYLFGGLCIMFLGAGSVSIDGLFRSRGEASEPAPPAK